MSDTPRYLDGFLAAIRPGYDRAPKHELQSETRPQPDAPILPPATAVAMDTLPVEEQIKRHLHPLDSFTRLLDCVGTNRAPAPDDQFRFRWFGLFYQAPSQDAFLLRLRLPGGRLKAFQLAGLAEITQAHASGQIVLNPQGGLDIPGVSVREAAGILRAVESIGLSAQQTGGDCVQAVRGGEDDGLNADDLHTLFGPLVCTLEQVLMHDRALADLPRPCEIIFQRANEPFEAGRKNEIDTVLLRQVPAPPPVPGNGSGADAAPAFLLAVRDDVEGGFLLPASRAVSGCAQLLRAWTAGADRTSRARAGLAPFCRALGREPMSALFEGVPWLPWPTRPATGPDDPASKIPPGLAIPGGRLLSRQLSLIEKVIREHNLGEIRLLRGRVRIGPVATGDAEAALCLALAEG